MLKKKVMYALLFVLGMMILSFTGFAIFVISTEKTQYKENKTFPFIEVGANSKTVVAYFSRSKNTEVAAKVIAKKCNARLLQIEAKDYEIGFKGWVHANQDARKRRAEIKFEEIDFSNVDTLYIGAPIWWYSPAPPIWEYVASNELEGVKVILFSTLNSKFEQQYIDQFSSLVSDHGGTFIDHIWVNRGRMGSQIDNKELEKVLEDRILE